MTTPGKIYVGLGSNLGDRAGNLLLGVRGMLNAGLHVVRLSSIYETEALGSVLQPPFLNMVAEVGGALTFTPEQVMARLLRVEYALGRTRELHMGPRTIDLDLLFYDQDISNTEFLMLPHPRLHERRFVLCPLAEIAPELVHPTLRLTVSELLARLDDESDVRLWHP